MDLNIYASGVLLKVIQEFDYNKEWTSFSILI